MEFSSGFCSSGDDITWERILIGHSVEHVRSFLWERLKRGIYCMRLYAQIILIVGLTVLAVAAVLFLIFELIVMGWYTSFDLSQIGLYSSTFLFISLVLLTLLFMGLSSWLLNNIIIAPLQDLNRYLLNIGDSGSLSGRIGINRDDEIGDLTSSINTMLASLEKAQRERITSEQRLSRLIDLVEEGICLVGPDGIIWFANPTMASIFETTTHDLTGRSITSILTSESQNSSENQDDQTLCMMSGQHEYHSRTSAGHDVWIRIGTAPYPLDTGRMGHLCVITDITPFRTAERELLLSNKKLALLGSMTRHDIVNQLTTIRGMLGLIKKKNADHALVQLITSAEDASERINKHIEFSKEYQK
ncbi:MAG: hypothetical protein CVV33_04010, partial [Methanomicrobiales archaeon HGW-Methanomicrobiales-4]